MIPVALDPRNVSFAVAGNADLALRRLRQLRRAGADVQLFADAPSPALAAEAGAMLRARLPADEDLGALHVLWIVDLPEAAATALAGRARARRVLVNVEDRTALCDFHSVAEVRRGDLLLTVSTGGAAPGLAGSIRRSLETCFASVWAERVEEVGGLRRQWRDEGANMPEIAGRIDALVAERCWLSCPKPH